MFSFQVDDKEGLGSCRTVVTSFFPPLLLSRPPCLKRPAGRLFKSYIFSMEFSYERQSPSALAFLFLSHKIPLQVHVLHAM